MDRPDEINLEIDKIRFQQSLQSYDDKFLSFLFLVPAVGAVAVSVFLLIFFLK